MIIWNKAPVFRILFPFLLGIALGYLTQLNFYSFYLAASALSLFVILLAFRFEYWQRHFRTVFFSAMMLCLGMLAINIQKQTWLPYFFAHSLSAESKVKLRILEPLVAKTKSYKTTAEVLAIVHQNQEQKSNGKIVLYFDRSALNDSLTYGDIIYAKNKISELKDAPNPFEFSPKKHLANKSIYHSCFLKKTDYYVLDRNEQFDIVQLGYTVRDYCLEIFRKHHLTGDEFAVAAAMILGFEDELNPQIISYFSASGAMHLLSVSGLHIAFVYIILALMLKPFRRFKWGAKFEFVFTVFVLWFYALVTGFSPPVLRSAIMFSFAVYAKTFGKQLNMFNVLATAAIFILVVDPLALLDVGFQLSFLALLSILLVQPHLNDLYYSKNYFLQKIWELSSVSISATVATLPFTFYYFHQFPNYFLFINILVIPLSTLLLYVGFAAIIFSWITPLAACLVWLLKYITFGLNAVLQFDESLPFSVTRNIQFSGFSILVLVLSITFFLYHLNLKHPLSKKLSIAMFVMFMLTSTLEFASKINHKAIVFYSVKQHTAIDFMDAYQTYFVADDSLLRREQDVKFHIYPNRMVHHATDVKCVALDSQLQSSNFVKEHSLISFYQYTFLIPQLSDTIWLNHKNISVDYLVINGQSLRFVQHLLKNVHPQNIIIEPVYKFKTKQKLLSLLRKKNYPYWDVQKSGAFVKEF
jgi:competence protein ComEC